MKKIEFKNLPDKTTPINSTNLNKVQDNIEEVFEGNESMGSIVVEDVTCKNIFNKNTVIHGYWINNGVLEANALWDTSDYIEVKPNTTYSYSSALISGKSEIQTTLIYYDADKNRISSSYFQTLTKTEATPSNCYYVRILYRNDVQENIQFEEGSVTNYVEHKEFENKEIYSTNEQVIGTWIDGKTLYRRTFNITSPSQINSSEPIIILESDCSIVKYDGFLDTANNGRYQLNCWFSSTDYIYSYVTDQNVLRLKVALESYASRPVTVTLEYTKTTD